MKAILRKISLIILAAVFIVSSNGVVIAIHTCFSSSTTDVTLFELASCCKREKKGCANSSTSHHDSINSECCSSEVNFLKISLPFVSSNQEMNFIAPAIISTSDQLVFFDKYSAGFFREYDPPLLLSFDCNSILPLLI